MSLLGDILPIFKKRELTFLESYVESDEVYTFIFDKPKDLTWRAGQHGILTITHRKITKPTRPFSIASSENENLIKISTIIGEDPSEYKKAMLELKKGMKIRMRGPIGPMYIKDSSPTLLIAGGIGVTPFRAILSEHNNRAIQAPLILLFLDSKGNFLYKNELDNLSKSNGIQVKYLQERNQLLKEIDNFQSKHEKDGTYFIAGSKSMVDSINNYLRSFNIPKLRIKKDSFVGLK